jgi:hypothetical protein
MLVVETETAVGYHGMEKVYLVYDETLGYKSYWQWFYTEEEAENLVEQISWETLNTEVVTYAYFELIKDYIDFYHRSWILQ